MNLILKLEQLGLFILSLLLFNQTELSWWIFAFCFLLPDIGMVGYLVNNKIGARSYNFFHHQGLAVVLFLSGEITELKWFTFVGILLLAHSAFDRILGYGLKKYKGFKHTHLGNLE